MRTSDGAAVRAEPSVEPMIDLMLVLIIILLVLTPALSAHRWPPAPAGENLTAHPDEPEDWTLAIDSKGQYFLNKQPIRNDQLGAHLRRHFSSRTTDRVLYVRADKRLEYRRVHKAIDVAAESGVHVVALIGERRSWSEYEPPAAGRDVPGEDPRR